VSDKMWTAFAQQLPQSNAVSAQPASRNSFRI
jgi:hypothetical protein